MINWLEKNNACKEGIDWCKENCGTMQDVWDSLKRIDWLVWVATKEGVLTDKELRLFACFCARQNWHLLTGESRNAIEVAERFANGNATKGELKAAYVAARAYSADAYAAYDAYSAAYFAARIASAAAYSAYAAAADAARVAYADAARAAAGKEQMEWLRANTTPNFGGTK